MTVKELIIANLHNLSYEDLGEIQKAISNHLNGGEMEKTAIAIHKHKGLVHAVKYVRSITGWSLNDCRDYVRGQNVTNS